MKNLYIIKLQDNKYYVGTTQKEPSERLSEHMSGRGSVWTKKHKPLLIIKEIRDCDKYDEDKLKKIYMYKHGIQNVRGGSYSQIDLNFETIELLKNEVNHANNKCLFCGKSDHFIKQCPSKKKPLDKKNKYHSKHLYYLNMSWDYEIEYIVESKSEDKENDDRPVLVKKTLDRKKQCSRCGYTSHFDASKCFARTHKEGYCL